MKQQIEEIIKKNLPEEVHNNGNHYDIAETVGFNRCLSQINTSLIADEVLKVVEKVIDDSIIEYQKEIIKSAEPFIPSDRNRYLIEKLNTLGKKIHRKLLTNSSTLEDERSEYLSPNKENK